MNRENRLNIIRDAVAFGGGGLLVMFSAIQQIRAGREIMLASACLLPGILGGFLIGMGAYSRTLGKWMHKTEERLNQLEKTDRGEEQ